MIKTCVELGLKECPACIIYKQGYNLGCWIDFYKKDIEECCHNCTEIKKYLVVRVSEFNRIKFYANNSNYIYYIKAAANSIDPKYSLFIDKAMLLI